MYKRHTGGCLRRHSGHTDIPYHDEEYHDDLETFNSWRFSDMREIVGCDASRHLLVSAELEYYSFGHEKHASYVRNFRYLLVSRSYTA